MIWAITGNSWIKCLRSGCNSEEEHMNTKIFQLLYKL